jgi:hypothetical protein
MRVFFLSVFLCFTKLVSAGPDNFGLGTGRDGALNITIGNAIINAYSAVTSSIAAGSTSITVTSAASFSPGDLVMVWQVGGLTPIPASGSAAAINLTSSNTGRWELARIVAKNGNTLTTSESFVNAFPATGVQLVRVPEYTSITVSGSGFITAPAWNGATGGIVAFLATGTVTLNVAQAIRVSGLGFRGGLYITDASGTLGRSGLDEPAPFGGQKGEGIVLSNYGSSFTGRGNFANGGGGGVAFKSGGGGGSNWAAGGTGGNSENTTDGNRAVGGLGGAPINYTDYGHLVLGGGGGAGHGDGASGRAGGAGGGVVFIRCAASTGSGAINASGVTAQATTTDGAGGGGAGGTIYFRVAGNTTTSLLAVGGTGGTVGNTTAGPGGGGGGGYILTQRGSGSPTLNVAGGNPGSQPSPVVPGGTSYGATAGGSGTINQLSGGLTVPAAPTISSPASGQLVNGTPTITGTTPVAGSTVSLFIDGLFVATTTSELDGSFSYSLLTELSDGAHTLQAYVVNQELYSSAAFRSFTSSAILPVRFTRLDARTVQVNGGWAVTGRFTTAEEQDVRTYVVERSAGTGGFQPIATVAPRNRSGSHTYTFTDPLPLEGNNTYRIREESFTGSISYSLTVQVRVGGSKVSLTLNPNPVVDNALVRMNLASAQTLRFAVVDATGRVLIRKEVARGAGPLTETLSLRELATGQYTLQVQGKNINETVSFLKK